MSAVSVISMMRRVGREPGPGQRLLHGSEEARLLDLAARYVDAHEQRRGDDSGPLPGHDPLAGFAEDPSADRQDRAVLLGDLDELARRYEAAARVLPANERLESGDASRLERDDRLVDEA